MRLITILNKKQTRKQANRQYVVKVWYIYAHIFMSVKFVFYHSTLCPRFRRLAGEFYERESIDHESKRNEAMKHTATC